MQLKINGKDYSLDVEDDMPLLWLLRDELDIVGPKYGCGIAQCGACTVHIGGQAVRSCVIPASSVWAEIRTIESLAKESDFHPIQIAWIDNQVAQCGYCQSGQIMQAASLLSNNSDPTDEEIDSAMTGNLCRCGTYPRIKKAVKDAAKKMKGE